MNEIVARVLAVAVLSCVTACSEPDRIIHANPDVIDGNGHVVEESRTIGSFSGVELRGIGDVYIQQGPLEQLSIRAEENLLPYLHAEVRSGELLIWKDAATLRPTRRVEFHLTVVNLGRLAMDGAGGIHAAGLATGPLALDLSGAGSIEISDLEAPSVHLDSTGVGLVTLSGTVQQQSIRLEGSGGYSGGDLASREADIVITGVGSATVRVEDRLTAAIGGSGSVYYIGDPAVDSSISGSGRVVRIDG
jgi:hypothetical protein